jgi:hypothetical protein
VETKPCVACGVQIHPASRRCTLCGSAQRTATLPGGWVGWTAGLAGVGVLLVVLVVVLGGGSKAGSPRFRQFATPGLTGLVPVGWTGGASTPPQGTGATATSSSALAAGSARRPAAIVRAAFDEPRQPDYRLVVTAQRPARGTARLRAAALRRLAMTRLGYVQHFFGRVLFPGGRPSWLLTYESDGFWHAAYIDTACKPGVAMTVEVSAPTRPELDGIAEPIAAASGPRCR